LLYLLIPLAFRRIVDAWSVLWEVVCVRRLFVVLLVLGACAGLLTFSGCSWLWPQSVVDFSLTPDSGKKPLLVDFEAILDGTAASYAWDFGDGSTSAEAAPSHVYYTAGTYTVTLTVVYDSGASASAEKADCVTVSSGFTAPSPKKLYWINGNTHDIKSGALTGGASTSLYGGISYGLSLTAGSIGIYCQNGNNLYKAAVDGSSFVFLHYYYGTPVSLCFDPAAALLYVTVHPSYYGAGGIVRYNANGGNREDWALDWGGSGDAMPQFLAIDPATGRLYCYKTYYQYGGVQPRSTVAASIEWTGTDTYEPHSITIAADECGGFAIDSGLSAGARYLYWTDVEKGRIDRCKIDGSEHVVLISGLDTPGPIAVDIQGGKLYWGDAVGIHRADLNGTNKELIFSGANAVSLIIGPAQ
jgi:PKD repeat protein